MNKKIITAGLILITLALLFPPVEYYSSLSSAISSAFGTSIEYETTLRPIFSIKGENMIGAEIKYSVWVIEILVITIFTSAIAYILNKKKD